MEQIGYIIYYLIFSPLTILVLIGLWTYWLWKRYQEDKIVWGKACDLNDELALFRKDVMFNKYKVSKIVRDRVSILYTIWEDDIYAVMRRGDDPMILLKSPELIEAFKKWRSE